MKNFLVIGNPIEHSLSPKIHNYWIKQNNINAIYEKKLLNKNELSNLVQEIRKNKISGANITVPFKKEIINLIDELTPLAKKVNSVNTLFKKDNKIIGGNTDVKGFEMSLKHIKYNIAGKNVLILGAGGVTSSIICSLESMGVSKIAISNRTIQKAVEIKKTFPSLNIIKWGDAADFDAIINTTSLGLKINDKIEINTSQNCKGKLFYDIIYNPKKTNFLLEGERRNSQIENGILMFIYQAQLAFKIWHGIKPEIDKKTIDLITND